MGKSKTIVGGENIFVEDTGSSLRIHAQVPIRTAEAEYNGYFKVVDNGDGTISVIDGADPENPICGQTDIGDVAKLTTPKPDNGLSIDLKAEYNTSGNKYILSIVTSGTNPQLDAYFELARIENNKLIQTWTGGIIYFGVRFII